MTAIFARKLTILNQYGLCARPAALFVKTASRFESEVTITKGDHAVSGKSIMGLMTLEGAQGVELIVKAEGPDAKEVVEELTALVNEGFFSGESCLPVPKEHSEWLVAPAAPPRPFRILRVAFALGSEMSQARERLVRTVIPSLRQRSRPRRLHVRCIDLGKRTQAAVGGPVAGSVCIDAIEALRPFFLLLGIHEAHRLPGLDCVPDEVADLRAFMAGGTADLALLNEEINTLVRCYHWSNDGGRYVLRSGVSDTEAAILNAAFRRRNDYLREHCLVLLRAQPAGAVSGQPDCLPDLRKQLGRSGWKCVEYADIESFSEAVSGVLERWVDAESDEGVDEQERKSGSEQENATELAEIGRRLATLTPRERDLARLIAAGQSSQEIAANLNISAMTVETHRMHLRDKLKVRSSAELSQMIRRAGALLTGQSIA